MAIFKEWTKEQEKEWEDWVATRPECIQKLCKQLLPNRLYQMKSTGQRVYVAAYSEDGTVRMSLSGKYNLVSFERIVFGIKPDDLVECDLPGPDEAVGVFSVVVRQISE